jgi:hypothetical protein
MVTLMPTHTHRLASWRILALALIAVLTAFTACVRSRPGQDMGNLGNEPPEPTTIEFRNESLAQADVFVVLSGSERRKLGTVFAGRTETLTIPSELARRGSVNIVARLLARSRAPSTGSLALSPGARLSVRLPMDEKALYVLPAN